MVQKIVDFFHGHKEVNWTQEEREACLKLLILIMYSDGTLSKQEDDLIRQNINSFDWRGVHHEDYFVNDTITKVRNLNNERSRELFIRECVDAMVSEEIQSEIVNLCSDLVKVDGESHAREVKIINLLQQELSLKNK